MKKHLDTLIKWIKIIDEWLLDLIFPRLGDDDDEN